MRNLFKIIFTITIASLILIACSDDDDDNNYLGTLKVNVTLKEGLSNMPIENLPVVLTNSTDNTENTANTDANGSVIFDNLAAGTYNVMISFKNEEENYVLNGTKNDIVIKAGEETDITVELDAANPKGGFVIKELYYNGADDNYISMFKDQFVEVFNNSNEVLYADGLYFANLHGETGGFSQENPITTYPLDDKYVYADWIEQIPGSGKDYPIEPGKSFVIALNAINFKEGNATPDKAVDNSKADFERYSVKWLEDKGESGNAYFDLDNPDVPNTTNIFIIKGLDHMLMETLGTGGVIFRKEDAFTDSDIVTYNKNDGTNTEVKVMRINVEDIIDGVECLENTGAVKFKRLPKDIDAGFQALSADGQLFFSGKSVRRKIDQTASKRFGHATLMDSNNSSVDFEVIDAPDQRGYDNYVIK